MWDNPYNTMPQNMRIPAPQAYNNPQTSSTLGILKGRPVSSIEEARASTIDFDGSITFFPDLANRRIYTKQFNLDGTASLKVYEYTELPPPNVNNSSVGLPTEDFITRSEFETAINNLKDSLIASSKSVSKSMPITTEVPKVTETKQTSF